MRTLGKLCVLLLMVSTAGLAQDTTSADQTQLLKSLVERVNALEQEVQQLKQQNRQLQTQQATTVAPVETTATPSTTPVVTTAVQQAVHDHTAAELPEVNESFPNLKIRGFANVDYSETDTKTQPSGFTMGQFVLHFSSALSRKVSFFGELSFTAQPSVYNADVERAIIRYDLNDHLKVSFGRYHAPINYWNTAFHHGAWLQTSISRPEMIRFGGRFLPVHFVGALAEGTIPSGPLGLNYNFGVGNGRQSITLLARDGDAGDVNGSRAFVASVFARPARFEGLQIGGAFYKDKVSPDATSVTKSHFDEWIASGHIVYERESPEVLAEFSHVRHSDILTGRTWDSQAAYAQIAYRLPWANKKFKPYYRFEYIHIPGGEPVLLIPELKGGHTVGTRYDITDFAAFKVEYRNWRRDIDADHWNGFFAQTAFTF
jgi:hypothetical protein